jgi:hypothetical protein
MGQMLIRQESTTVGTFHPAEIQRREETRVYLVQTERRAGRSIWMLSLLLTGLMGNNTTIIIYYLLFTV